MEQLKRYAVPLVALVVLALWWLVFKPQLESTGTSESAPAEPGEAPTKP